MRFLFIIFSSHMLNFKRSRHLYEPYSKLRRKMNAQSFWNFNCLNAMRPLTSVSNIAAASTFGEYYEWDVQKLLGLNCSSIRENAFALILLNSPILLSFDFLLSLWNKASLRLTVDGGTNRWYSLVKENYCSHNKPNINEYEKETMAKLVPDIISGDFDSIHPSVLAYYKDNGVTIIQTEDQNKTDFMKALEIVTTRRIQVHTVLVLCEFYGRFDQIMANINVLYKAYMDGQMKQFRIVLISSFDATWILKPGFHKIIIPQKLWTQKSSCALIPLGVPCSNVTTTGLKWNLKNSRLEFGGIVSTSNTYNSHSDDPVITINTSSPVVWSMTIGGL